MRFDRKYLSLDEDARELLIDLGDGQQVRLSTEEVDKLLHDLMEFRIHLVPGPDFKNWA